MVNVVARHAAHIAAVMLSAGPLKTRAIARVTYQTLVVGPRLGLFRSQLSRIVDVFRGNSLFTILDVLRAVAVTAFAASRARIC